MRITTILDSQMNRLAVFSAWTLAAVLGALPATGEVVIQAIGQPGMGSAPWAGKGVAGLVSGSDNRRVGFGLGPDEGRPMTAATEEVPRCTAAIF